MIPFLLVLAMSHYLAESNLCRMTAGYSRCACVPESLGMPTGASITRRHDSAFRCADCSGSLPSPALHGPSHPFPVPAQLANGRGRRRFRSRSTVPLSPATAAVTPADPDRPTERLCHLQQSRSPQATLTVPQTPVSPATASRGHPSRP